MDNSRTRILNLLFSIVAVATVVLATHWPCLSAKALSFDDNQYLTENILVKNPSWNSTREFLCEVLEPSTVGGYYQPLAMISLMLDYARGGRAENPYVFHQTSLLLHLFNTTLVIILVFSLFGRVWIAAAVGLLFGIHPMTVETIAWVGERKTVLAAFFSLLSLNFYIAYSRKGKWKFYILTVLTYVLALMSKPTSTPLPLLMLVLDYWPLRRLDRTAVVEKLPMLTIGCVSGVITIISQARTASVQLPGSYPLTAIPLRICYSLAFYISKIFYPVHLSSHYPFPEPFNLAQPMVLAGVTGTLVLIALAVLSARWTRVLLAGLFFFLVGILPTVQVIGFSRVVASDKFAYLPAAGLLISGAYLFIRLWDLAAGWDRGWICRVGIVAIGLFAAQREITATRHYLTCWRDTESLFLHMIEMSPKAATPYNNLGAFYYKQGSIDKAVEQWSISVVLNPDYPDALNNLAWVLATDDDIAKKYNGKKAVLLAERACQLTGYKDASMLDTLGAAYARSGDFSKAVITAQKAVQICTKPAQKEMATEIEARLKLYQQGKVYRQPQLKTVK